MLLAIDIGNTTTGFAVIHKSGHIVTVVTIDTDSKTSQMKALVAKIFKAHAITRAVICSVVPKATKTLENILKKIGATRRVARTVIPVDIIGRDIIVPIKNRYKNPKQVGQDRLVGAYAARKIYGCPLIVVDLGTAITFDVISAQGDYLGGAIVPGLRLSAESLFLKTALLPRIEIQAPRHIIGKTTQESILSGLFYGYGSLCKGMIDLLSVSLRGPRRLAVARQQSGDEAISVKVVMTGGHTRLMKKFVFPKTSVSKGPIASTSHSCVIARTPTSCCRKTAVGGRSNLFNVIDEDLVFKGIYFLSNS